MNLCMCVWACVCMLCMSLLMSVCVHCATNPKIQLGLNTETEANNTLLQVIYLIQRLAAYFNSSLTGQLDSIAPDAVPLLNSESISAD